MIIEVIESEKGKEAFENHSGVVGCMDGGTPKMLAIGGSGNLLERDELVVPDLPDYREFFAQFGVELKGDAKVLLPKEAYLEQYKVLVQKGIIKGVSSHEECGAAGLDLVRILEASGIEQEKVTEIKNNPGWGKMVNAHAKTFSQVFADAISSEHPDFIPIDEMARESHHHIEEAVYVDCIGGKKPGFAFDFQKASLPNGFTLHSEVSDIKHVLDSIGLTFGIAKVKERFSKENPFVIVVIIDKNDPAIGEEILAGISKVIEGFEDFVEIQKVAPNL